ARLGALRTRDTEREFISHKPYGAGDGFMTSTDIRTGSKASKNLTKNARRASMMMAAVLGAIGAANSAHAVDLFWDSDGAGAGTGGTGGWLNPNTWHAGTATGTLQNWAD